MSNSQSDNRFYTIIQIIENYLKPINLQYPNLFQEVAVNRNNVQTAIEEYFSDIEHWRKYFNLKGNMDRHKVAALTIHYLSKNQIIDFKVPINKLGLHILPLINELILLNIAFGRLKNGGHIIKPQKKLYAHLLRILYKHRVELAQSNELVDCKNWVTKYIMEYLSIFTYLTEENHFHKCGLPYP